MAKGRVSKKGKAEDTADDAAKNDVGGPPTKKSKTSEEAVASASVSSAKKLVKMSIEHCTS